MRWQQYILGACKVIKIVAGSGANLEGLAFSSMKALGVCELWPRFIDLGVCEL